MTHDRMKNRGIRPELIKRIVIYSILVLIISVAQCSFFASLDICPATPDLILGIVLAVALLDTVQASMVVGICAGFLCDALSRSGSVSFSALFYFVIAVLFGILAQKMLPRFMSWLCLMLPALVLKAAYTALCICINIRALPSIALLGSVLLPELITTALLCLPIYPIVKLCVIPMKSHSRFSF